METMVSIFSIVASNKSEDAAQFFMIATKNWVRFVKFDNIKQIKICLASIFQPAAAGMTSIVAPSTKWFPWEAAL